MKALAIAGIGATVAGLSVVVEAPAWTLAVGLSALIAGLTYFEAHLTRSPA